MATNVHPPHIFIATYAEIENDPSQLSDANIKHILTFDSNNANFNHLVTRVYGFKITTIPIKESDDDQLNTSLPQIVRFISRSILREENVLICSERGVNRAVIAAMCYVVAREHVSVQEAFDMIKKNKPDAQPSEQYLQMLEIYISGKDKPAASEAPKRITVESSTSVDTARELRDSLQHLEQSNQMSFEHALCKKCRQEIFTAQDLIEHATEGRGKKEFSFKKKKKDLKTSMNAPKKLCNAYFMEKKSWMGSMDTDSGDISCPNCHQRIGSFKWSGLQCSCGVWVRPAVQILKSRVDTD